MHNLSLVSEKVKSGNTRYYIISDDKNDNYKDAKYDEIFNTNGFRLYKGKYWLKNDNDVKDAEIFIEDFNEGNYDKEDLYPQLKLVETGNKKLIYKIEGPSTITYKFKEYLDDYFKYYRNSYILRDNEDYESAEELINLINRELKDKYEKNDISNISPNNIKKSSLILPIRKVEKKYDLTQDFNSNIVNIDNGKYFVNIRVSYIPVVRENDLHTFKGNYTFKKALDKSKLNEIPIKFITEEGVTFELENGQYKNIKDKDEIIF